jgi:hypothetical protein
MLPKFLQPERVPFASIEFHTFITSPVTGRLLDAMIEDNRATDARILAEREDTGDDGTGGDRCGTACGFCGRCS